jgi:hypothetical protein
MIHNNDAIDLAKHYRRARNVYYLQNSLIKDCHS